MVRGSDTHIGTALKAQVKKEALLAIRMEKLSRRSFEASGAKDADKRNWKNLRDRTTLFGLSRDRGLRRGKGRSRSERIFARHGHYGLAQKFYRPEYNMLGRLVVGGRLQSYKEFSDAETKRWG